jgi:RNA polymerase sigma-70 factor (ECF subfamily)
MPDDEAHLIALAQRADAAACAALYGRHYDAVYRYCYYRVADVTLAQDLAAEVFVRMVEKLHTFEPRRPLLAWLYTVAHNLIADLYRRHRDVTHLSLSDAAHLVPHSDGELARTVDRSLQADCLATAMKQLTEDQRQVILLKFIEDLGNGQIARMMGKTEGAIKSLQHRALEALRRALEKEGCYEAGY